MEDNMELSDISDDIIGASGTDIKAFSTETNISNTTLEEKINIYKEIFIPKIKDKKISKFIDNNLVIDTKIKNERYLFLNRFRYLRDMMLSYPMYRDKFIVTTFVLKCETDNIPGVNIGDQVNFGMLLSIYDYDKIVFNLKERNVYDIDNLYGDDYNNIEHMYIINSPAYVSMDGEYRKQLISYKQFTDVYEENEDILLEIEDILLDRMNNGDFSFDFNIFYPFSFMDRDEFYQDIRDSRIMIRSLAACIVSEMKPGVHGYIENHTNKIYFNMMFNSKEVKKYKKIYDKYDNKYDESDKYFEGLQFQLTYYYSKEFGMPLKYRQVLRNFASCGIKIIPLKYEEFYNINDISFDSWRELYLSIDCSDLPLNNICPGFPFVSNYTFIQNADPLLFNNPSMIQKYLNGKLAGNINDKLAKVNDLTEENGYPINNQFKKLSNRIDDAIIYSESDIEMSSVALGIIYENLGRTFGNWLKLHNNLETDKRVDLFSKQLMLKDEKYMWKLMFEYIYEIYCMHTKKSVTHLDLHLNNITIYFAYPIFRSLTNPKSAYIIDDNMYIFDDWGYQASLIDFSRAIIFNFDNVEKLYGPSVVRKLKLNSSDRLFNAIKKYFPNIVDEYEEQLDIKLISDFENVAILCSNMDYWFLFENLSIELEKIPNMVNISKLLSKLSKDALKYFNKTIIDYLDDKDVKIKDIGFELIQKHFKKFLFDTNSNYNNKYEIINFYNYNGDMEFDALYRDKYPPMYPFSYRNMYSKKPELFLNEILATNYDETKTVDDVIDKKINRIKGF